MRITPNQHKATGEVIDLIVQALGVNREVHSATAITTSARLSGAFLFESFALDVKDVQPGNVVLSEQANREGPGLINVMGAALSKYGITIDNQKMEAAGMQTAELDFLQSMDATLPKAHGVMNKYKLDHKEMAISCALSTAFLIEQCKQDIKVESGFKTAIYGLIEGSKTMPPKRAISSTSRKKWFKFW